MHIPAALNGDESGRGLNVADEDDGHAKVLLPLIGT